MNDLSPSTLSPRNLSDAPHATVQVDDPVPGSPAYTAIFLQDLVLDGEDVEVLLTELARAAAHHLTGPDQDVFCGVTLLRPKHTETVASSSPAARELDEIQYTYKDGPCLRAARTHELVHVRDTRIDDRWPEFFSAIAHHGMSSILGVPIPLDGEADCALNLYSSTVDAFTPQAVAAAEVFAAETSRSLRLAVRIAQLTDRAENLNAALESRTTIDLAAGIIMGQNKCSQSAAINIMKTAASHRQVKLNRLAHELVTTIGNEPPATHFD